MTAEPTTNAKDPTTRVLIVDDHPLVRAGLAGLLAAAHDLEVVAEASGGEQALQLADSHELDVVLMDLSMPGMGGVEATRRLCTAHPGICVVVLTSLHDPEKVTQALRAGATGFLLKDSEPDAVLAAVRGAARGEVPIDPRVAQALLPKPSVALSAREEQVLRRIMAGLSNKQIGSELGIAERTVKVHVGNLFRRIGVADRTSAAMWARDHLADG
jgi:DNA-binding NarL/FixJ family response regulator